MKTRDVRVIFSILLFFVQFIVLAACVDSSSWELVGEVKFIGLKELTDVSDIKKGILEYSIHNAGKSKIESCCFAFSFSTDQNTYHDTVVEEKTICGGALIYGQVTIAYIKPDEVGAFAKAVIDSVQFK
jgi:hypothetical protein